MQRDSVAQIVLRNPGGQNLVVLRVLGTTASRRVVKGEKVTVFMASSRILTSDQARLPAEFKHINKRRKRN